MNDLRRVTINLTLATDAALAELAEDGTSKTDAINQAVRLAAVIRRIAGTDFVVESSDGSRHRLVVV